MCHQLGRVIGPPRSSRYREKVEDRRHIVVQGGTEPGAGVGQRIILSSPDAAHVSLYRRPLPTSPAPEIDQTLSVHWSRDGRRLFAALRPAGQGARVFRIYLREGDEAWRAVTPEATAGVFAVSPDGASVALRDDTGVVGAVPARRRRAAAAGMHRRDVATGRIESWRSIAPADPADVFHVVAVVRASDSQSYVCQCSRGSNEPSLARGLR